MTERGFLTVSATRRTILLGAWRSYKINFYHISLRRVKQKFELFAERALICNARAVRECYLEALFVNKRPPDYLSLKEGEG